MPKCSRFYHTSYGISRILAKAKEEQGRQEEAGIKVEEIDNIYNK